MFGIRDYRNRTDGYLDFGSIDGLTDGMISRESVCVHYTGQG